MANNKVSTAKIDSKLKEELRKKALEKNSTMTNLVLLQFRELLKKNDLPTI